MAKFSASSPLIVLAFGTTTLLLASCYSGPPADLNGPRNGGDRVLVDPQTGVPLPGQFNGTP